MSVELEWPTTRASQVNTNVDCAAILWSDQATDNWKGYPTTPDTALLFSGLRILGDDDQTDLVEARALGHGYNVISVYSNSWGPFDYGFTVEGPGHLVQRTFQTGAKKVISFDHIDIMYYFDII